MVGRTHHSGNLELVINDNDKLLSSLKLIPYVEAGTLVCDTRKSTFGRRITFNKYLSLTQRQ